jgi:hypothetical protein
MHTLYKRFGGYAAHVRSSTFVILMKAVQKMFEVVK